MLYSSTPHSRAVYILHAFMDACMHGAQMNTRMCTFNANVYVCVCVCVCVCPVCVLCVSCVCVCVCVCLCVCARVRALQTFDIPAVMLSETPSAMETASMSGMISLPHREGGEGGEGGREREREGEGGREGEREFRED